MLGISALFNGERRVFAHVFQWRQTFFSRSLRQTRNAVFEYPLIIFFDAQFFARSIRRFKIFANTQATIWIDTPRKLDPEFVLFPNLSGIGLICVIEFLTTFFAQHAQHRLTEADPRTGLS